MAEKSEDFKQVQKTLQQNVCGDDPEDHFVNCCGPDQYPSEIDPFIDGKFQVVLMKIGQIDYIYVYIYRKLTRFIVRLK